MAALLAGPLDMVRQAINSLDPERPNMAGGFTVGELQRLYDEGFQSVDDLKDACRESLQAMGLQPTNIDGLMSGGLLSGLDLQSFPDP